MIKARHTFRKDRNGNHLVAEFELAKFNAMPVFVRWNEHAKRMQHLPNGGWVCIEDCSGVSAPTDDAPEAPPEPLKKSPKKSKAKSRPSEDLAKNDNDDNDKSKARIQDE